MSKPQFVLEEALETYLYQICYKHDSKAVSSLISFNVGLLAGLKAANNKILTAERPNDNTDKN